MDTGSWIGISSLTVVCAAACGVVASRTRCGEIAVATFVLHALAAVGFYGLFGLASPDAGLYHEIALLVARGEDLSVIGVGVGVGKEGFVLLLGLAYATFGETPLVGLIINSLFCALIVPFVADSAHHLGAPPRRAALLVALFPPLLVWGTPLLREPVTWLLMSAFTWALIRMSDHISAVPLLTALAALSGLLSIRGSLVTLVGLAGLIGYVLARRGRGTFSLLAMTGIAYVLFAQRLAAVGSGYNLESINNQRSALSTQGASGFETVNLANPVSVLRSLPEMMTRVALGPFPWEWPALGITAAASTVCWLVLLFWAFRGARRVGARSWLAWCPALSILVALALTSGNYGTLDRLRVQSAVILLPLAAAGMRRGKNAPTNSSRHGRAHANDTMIAERSTATGLMTHP